MVNYGNLSKNRPVGEIYLNRLLRGIVENCQNPVQAANAFGGGRPFGQVLATIEAIERANGPVVDPDFLVKDELFVMRAGSDATHAAMEFSRLMDKWDHGTRPSLPGAAYGWLDQLGLLNTDNPYQNKLNDAALLIAARAEMVKGAAPPGAAKTDDEPEYHSRLHFLHVLQAAGHLLERHGKRSAANPDMPALNNHDQTLLLIAALAHDIDHPGHGNRKCARTDKAILYENEEKSFLIANEICEACGLGAQDRNKVLAMVRTTDPNGPHKFMKNAMQAHEEGQTPRLEDAAPNPGEAQRFYDLSPILEDKKLCYMSAVLSDADLFVSAGAGFHAQFRNSEKFSKEMNASGVRIDFTTAGARDFFFRDIVGEKGFASAAGREAFNDVFHHMADCTRKELAQQDDAKNAGPSAPSA